MQRLSILSALLISVSILTFSQNEQQEVIPAAGDYYTGSSATLSVTIGETVSETYYGNGGILTAGFQQPFVFYLKVDAKSFLEGCYFINQMIPFLNAFGYLPLLQPYNTTPWNYNGNETVTSIPDSNIIDWVLVELRGTTGDASTATEATIISRKAGFVLSNGSIVDTDGYSPITLIINGNIENNLYIVLWHRCHLGIMSSNPGSIINGVCNYDFTISASQAYGGINSVKYFGEGNWGMVGGNGLNDEQINNNDKNDIWLLQEGQMGYLNGDYNMDGEVTAFDKIIIWESNAGKSSYLPHDK